MEQDLDTIKKRLDELELLIADSESNENSSEEIESEFYSIIEDFEIIKDDYLHSKAAKKIAKRIKEIRNELDLPNEEDILDYMFSDRHEEGYDEDSNSNLYDNQ